MPAPGNTHIFRRIWPLLDPESCVSGYPAKSGDVLGANEQTQDGQLARLSRGPGQSSKPWQKAIPRRESRPNACGPR